MRASGLACHRRSLWTTSERVVRAGRDDRNHRQGRALATRRVGRLPIVPSERLGVPHRDARWHSAQQSRKHHHCLQQRQALRVVLYIPD